MKPKIYLITLLVATTFVISVGFRSNRSNCTNQSNNYPSGASANLGLGYTGASWDNSGRTCSQSGCHSGGTYNPTTTISLLSGGVPVTQYVPGSSYTFNIRITSASGTPKYAFNAMCATSTTHININKWGTMPTGSRNTTAGGRNYVEQTSARTATGTNPSYYSVNIPWTAPVAGTGSVTFWAEGMAVNGNGGTSGDSPAPSVNITITEAAPVPVLITSVTAEKTSNGILINWATAQEINTAEYTIEHSTDGSSFSSIATVAAMNASNGEHYSYTHLNILTGKHYYRVKETDRDGAVTYSKIVAVNLSAKQTLTLLANPVGEHLVLTADDDYSGSSYIINSINGMRMATGKLQNNQVNVANLVHGTYIFTLILPSGAIQSTSFIKE